MRHAENSSTSAVSRKISLGKDSKVSSVYNFPALSKALPWSPQMKYAEIDANRYETKTTTLDNGFRVRIVVFLFVYSFEMKSFGCNFSKDCFRETLWRFLHCWRYLQNILLIAC